MTTNPSKGWDNFAKKVSEAIKATYPEDLFRPVPKELRAQNDVAAQLLRDMSDAIGLIASQTLGEEIESAKREAYDEGYRACQGNY